MLKYELSKEQYNELEGLAYWISDAAYIRERSGNDDPELSQVDKTIRLTFDCLDRLKVPYWVQNTVICFAENWRRWQEIYLDNYLKTKNITIAA